MPDRAPRPATDHRRPRPRGAGPTARFAAAVVVLLLVVLGPAACLTDPTPTALGADEADRLTATITEVDGVAAAEWVDARQSAAYGDRTKPAVDVRIGATTAASDAEGFAEVAAAVAAELPPTRRVTARVVQRELPGLPDLQVDLSGADDDGNARALRVLTDLAGLPGVSRLEVARARVGVAATDSAVLGPIAAAVRRVGVPRASLTTDDRRVSTEVEPRLLDAGLLALVGRVDRWPGVTSQLVRSTAPGEVFLQVQVGGDGGVTGPATALRRTPWPPGGPVVRATVLSSAGSETVVVGRPAPGDPTSPWPDDPAAPACAGADLDVTLGGFDAALGRRYLLLTATNTSDASCAVQGRPAITFVRASGTPAPDVETGTPSGTPEPGRYVLPPGERLHAGLTWRGMSTALDPDVTVTLRVTAAPGADPVDVPAGEHTLDVLAGAAVEVGAWEPAPEGWALDGGDG
ncbi:DUF4232 domain-containing protein [Cellulomonas sp. Y8]|uniref:DUF4232 domain-containing protein n=1 Tax=Cellulomonas sp. Y8 TaxID=2591145 RepID=UPI003D7452D5